MNHVLFEVGIEELPARFIDQAEKQLQEKTEQWLKEHRITYESLVTFSTPRRLAIIIQEISEYQTSVTEEVRGPSAKVAKDKDGNWTKAAIGFTKGQGKTVDDIYFKEIKGTSYSFVENYIEGEKTFNLLHSYKEVIKSIQFPENMRWSSETFRFSRPIRWLVALYNDQVIPFEIANVKTNNKTYGHRFLGKEIILTNPLNYEEKLTENFVIPKAKDREKLIIEGIKKLEEEQDFHIVVENDLLQEVRNLIEYPTVFYGTFADEFLDLPAEVLITSMKEHQRYFPVQSKEGNLLPFFIGVRNGDDHQIENIVKGNEKVLRARLSDGKFFYEEDQKQSISFYLDRLTRVVFHEQLGTISEKVARVKKNSEEIAQLLQVDSEILHQTARAAEISKFDLMTNMVNEFTELQGIMGEKYALVFGEDKDVATAIREHYLPLTSEGTLPKSVQGSILSIADKLDTIVGVISAGMMPTGSQDPYSLRRQAIGILRIVQANKWSVSIEDLLEISFKHFENKLDQTIKDEIVNFFKLRAAFLLRRENIEQDVIDSVLQKEIGVFSFTLEKASVLSTKRNDHTFKNVQEALVRVLNLANLEEYNNEIEPKLFKTSSEEELYNEFKQVSEDYLEALKKMEAEGALSKLAELANPIHMFFDNNMVMVDHKETRENRLALVNNIAHLIYRFADLSMIQWKLHHE